LPVLVFSDFSFKKHHSIPRNKLLAKPMYLAGYIESYGTGIEDIIKLCTDEKLPPPEFTQTDGLTLTIKRPIPSLTKEEPVVNGTKSGPSQNTA